MEALAATAAAADAMPEVEDEPDVEVQVEADPKKAPPIPGMKKVNGVKTRLDAATKKLTKSRNQLDTLQQKSFTSTLTAAERGRFEKYEKEITQLEKIVPNLEAELEEATEAMEVLKAAAAAKEKKKAEEAEDKRAMSEAGILELCDLRLNKYSKRFENSSDTAGSASRTTVARRSRRG